MLQVGAPFEVRLSSTIGKGRITAHSKNHIQYPPARYTEHDLSLVHVQLRRRVSHVKRKLATSAGASRISHLQSVGAGANLSWDLRYAGFIKISLRVISHACVKQTGTQHSFVVSQWRY